MNTLKDIFDLATAIRRFVRPADALVLLMVRISERADIPPEAYGREEWREWYNIACPALSGEELEGLQTLQTLLNYHGVSAQPIVAQLTYSTPEDVLDFIESKLTEIGNTPKVTYIHGDPVVELGPESFVLHSN
jgi:hypothetical protein